jgi:hypothetical protein
MHPFIYQCIHLSIHQSSFPPSLPISHLVYRLGCCSYRELENEAAPAATAAVAAAIQPFAEAENPTSVEDEAKVGVIHPPSVPPQHLCPPHERNNPQPVHSYFVALTCRAKTFPALWLLSEATPLMEWGSVARRARIAPSCTLPSHYV